MEDFLQSGAVQNELSAVAVGKDFTAFYSVGLVIDKHCFAVLKEDTVGDTLKHTAAIIILQTVHSVKTQL